MLELNYGDFFAGCKIISLCGKGGYGTVYLAEDATGKKVAVKIINTNEKQRELEGIRNYMPISHQSPYLLSIFHVGLEQNELFLVMEVADSLAESQHYVPDTLARRLQLYGRVSPPEALNIIQKVALAVKTLHDAKLIHRDIKPDNIIFVNGEPRLSDPGLICSTEKSITLAGTLGFLPPECFYGTDSNSIQSDIYALGKLFYCIVTGEAPGKFPFLPRDLSFPLCRKILPVLLKSCNNKKKKRYNSIDEFLTNLPKKLPTPGFFSKFQEKFRIWRLMHCYLYYSIILSLFLIIALIGGISWHLHQEKLKYLAMYEKFQQEKLEFEKKINAKDRYIILQLTRLSNAKISKELMTKFTSLPNDIKKAQKLMHKYESILNTYALKAVENGEKNSNAIKRAATIRALLKSPLGMFLTSKQKQDITSNLHKYEKDNKEILTKSLQLEKTFYPDSSGIFEFAYVPPGEFISPSTKKQVRIDYPIWVAPEKLSVRQFSRMCRFMPPNSRNQELPAVRFLWNDILYGCLNANNNFQVVASFPPGYIVRPLTIEELEYCASASKNTLNGKANEFGLYEVGGNIGEIVSANKFYHKDSVIALKDIPKAKKTEFVYYQSFMKNVGTRIAIAPGTPNFYKDNFKIGTAQHVVVNGKHYEFFGHLCANFSRKDAENICHLLGGKLASIDSKEVLDKIHKVASPIINYNICVAANYKDGKWYWDSGKLVKKAPPKPKEGEFFVMSGKKFLNMSVKKYLGFICEWTTEEYKNRTNWQTRIKQFSPNAIKTFSIDGKLYAHFRFFMNYPHLCRRYAQIIGGKLAEVESVTLQKRIGEQLKEYEDFATLLGGYWHNGSFYWYTSKNEIKEPLALVGQVVDTALSLSSVAIKGGKLCTTQLPVQFLVEFPSLKSSQK